jgi:hypothetical protein
MHASKLRSSADDSFADISNTMDIAPSLLLGQHEGPKRDASYTLIAKKQMPGFELAKAEHLSFIVDANWYSGRPFRNSSSKRCDARDEGSPTLRDVQHHTHQPKSEKTPA